MSEPDFLLEKTSTYCTLVLNTLSQPPFLSVSLSLFDDRNAKMSAADRAKARREAILKRGQDRLAKLTTSARGEDHPAYRDDLAGMLVVFLGRFIWF